MKRTQSSSVKSTVNTMLATTDHCGVDRWVGSSRAMTTQLATIRNMTPLLKCGWAFIFRHALRAAKYASSSGSRQSPSSNASTSSASSKVSRP